MKFWLCIGAAVLVALVYPDTAWATPLFLIGATTEVTDLDSAMKIIFTDPIHENFVTDTELLDIFEEDNNVQVEETTGGRYIETAQYFVLPGAVGSRAPGDYIPVPEGPSIANSKVYLKKHFATLQMTGDVMARVKSNIGAYIDYMDRALPDVLERFNNDIDRQLLGYGAGVRAQAGTVVTGAAGTVVVENAIGVEGWTNAWLQFQDFERIVASVALDGDPLRNVGASQSGKITDIDPDTETLTFDTVPSEWAEGDYLFGGDASGSSNQTAAGADRELMGLAGMVDNGDILQLFQELDRDDYRLWRAQVIDGQGGSFTGDLDEIVLTAADNRAFVRGKGKPTVIVTSREQADKFWLSLIGDRRLIDPKAYEGGRSAVSVRLGDRVVPIRVIRKMPPELAYMLDTSKGAFKKWQIDGGAWDDKTGSIWNRVTDGTGRKDDFYAVYIWYCQMGCVAPAKSVRIENLVP